MENGLTQNENNKLNKLVEKNIIDSNKYDDDSYSSILLNFNRRNKNMDELHDFCIQVNWTYKEYKEYIPNGGKKSYIWIVEINE